MSPVLALVRTKPLILFLDFPSPKPKLILIQCDNKLHEDRKLCVLVTLYP